MRNFVFLFSAFLLSLITVSAQIGTPVEVASPPDYSLNYIFRDFENDGDIDMLYGLAPFDGGIHDAVVVENLGGGLFQTHVLTGIKGYFAEINGDGLLDIVTAYNATTVLYLENLGNYVFDDPIIAYEVPQAGQDYGGVDFWDIGVGDVNNDGDDEILLTSDMLDLDGDGDYDNNSTVPSLGVFDMISPGVFSPPSMLYDAFAFNNTFWLFNFWMYGEAFSYQITDYNADGYNDVLISWHDMGFYSELGVLYGHADGSFTPEKVFHELSASGGYSLENFDNQNAPEMTGVCYQCLDETDYNYFLTTAVLLVDERLFGLNTTYDYAGNAVELGFTDDSGNLGIYSPNGNSMKPQGVNMDADVYNEIIYFHSDGQYFVFDDIQNLDIDTLPMNNNDLFIEPLFIGNLISLPQLEQVEVMDIDNDGIDEFIFVTEGHIYIAPIITTPVALGTVQVNVYVDTNENGALDSGEVAFNSGWVHIEPVNHDVYISSTSQQLSIEYGTYNFTYTPTNPLLWMLTSAPTVSVTLDAMTSNADVFFGIAPNTLPVSQASLFNSSNLGLSCNTSSSHHSISFQNTGNTIIDGTISYTIDPLVSFISAVPAPASVAGNTITWDYSVILPGQYMSIQLTSTSPDASDFGSTIINQSALNIEDSFGSVIFTDSYTEQRLILCSYDPNDITEHNGYTENGYVLPGTELEYTIRFQNTGNAPANNVRIENQLNAQLDRGTFQPVGWSHDFELMIDENNKAIFSFNGINLPDSTNNEADSHGFVTYRIMPVADLPYLTVINNSAEIYFDLNPAVVTNTEINTIYTCSDLEQFGSTATVLCAGDEITLHSNAAWIEDLTWSFNGELVGEGNYFTYTLNESGTMVANISNALCASSHDFILVPANPLATITVAGNVLTANSASSYQWYLNGQPIVGDDSQSLIVTQNGNYSVVITNNAGCEGISQEVTVTNIGMEELNSVSISLYPNPTSGIVNVTVSGATIGSSIIVTDMLGKEVLNAGKLTGNSFKLDCSSLSNGVYEIRIGNLKSTFVKQ
jgi:uncharacterized repeat protein (TIGR01451 family)